YGYFRLCPDGQHHRGRNDRSSRADDLRFFCYLLARFTFSKVGALCVGLAMRRTSLAVPENQTIIPGLHQQEFPIGILGVYRY
ncbi:MAG: hypothetical protein OXE41_03890, partial [Gammaproteobacteria bacterium]|nr:hypothetical protein [Gammaproteobacteria bacterium]